VRRAAKTGVWHPVALSPEELRRLAAGFDGRVILRIGVELAASPRAGRDERGRHAIAGPPEWIAERLSEYVEAGCDGFVVNLGYDRPGLEERVHRFGNEVAPLIR
jgi:alkanesulfonate monooxygenase SsuD/methylene tetrahydromethanopterin reductase-like flavin-dependent oxidoreductase (luciferase family)